MEKFEQFMTDLILSIAITVGVYVILTAPHLCYIYLDTGFRYPNGACILCGIASAVIGHIVSDKLKL
jgi:hypothetical protein